ncbi:MAG: hypothetical protein OXC68_14705, partial [Aestuariivita sp.]|nr:hypothetical protein [Aestuariivita sp.]
LSQDQTLKLKDCYQSNLDARPLHIHWFLLEPMSHLLDMHLNFTRKPKSNSNSEADTQIIARKLLGRCVRG